MNTMKEGTGSDPFAEDDEEPKEQTDTNESTSSVNTTTDENSSPQKYPYVLRRDTVKDDRGTEKVALLRDEYVEKEAAITDALATELDIQKNQISVFDVREALYQLGEEHPERLAEILLEWGYDAKQD